MYLLSQDLRFTLKLMRKRLGMTSLVLAALVLGMGLNAAIFSVVNAVLLRPLPIFRPDRVVWLHSVITRTGAQLGTSYPDFFDWKSQNRSFEDMAAMYFFTATLNAPGTPEHIKVVGISASGFHVWGVRTILGRDFSATDDQPGAERVLILTYKFWQRKFGGDPAVLGKTLVLDDQPYSIIGVLQPTPVTHLSYADVYTTNGPLLSNSHIAGRDTRWFFPVGRLKAHVSVAQAQADLETITARLAAQYPAMDKDLGIRLESMTENLTGHERKPLLFLIAASALIFLLAAANVMTAFLAGTLERAQELSVRLAVGATRSILFRQLLLEAFLLALVGAGLGLLAAELGLRYFLYRFPNATPRFHETNLDLVVIVVTLAMAFAATLIASLPPAIHIFRLNIGRHLRRESALVLRHKYRLLGRGAFLLAEVALASGLSLVAGLLLKSLYEAEHAALGFNPHQVFTFQISPSVSRYQSAAEQSALYQAALQRLAALPGMSSISGISSLPLTNQQLINRLKADTQSPLSAEQILVEDESVLPGFFRALRLPLIEGRDFTNDDRETTPPVAIVDDALAAKLWPGQSPIGKQIQMSPMTSKTNRWLEVVGVVREIKHFGPERPVKWMQVYVPQYQDPSPVMSFVVNTTIHADAIEKATKASLHELDPELPVENFDSLDNYLDNNFLGGRQISLLLFSIFASIGLALGAIGVYAVAANLVTQRRRELAIRMALGATPARIVFLIARLGLFATLGGILMGSAIVASLTRLLASFLYGVSTLDPLIYAGSAILLILLTVTASLIPAVRLLRWNLQDALRQP